MKQLAPGILVGENGLHYFSAERVRRVLLDVGLDNESAAIEVGKLISAALTAEFKEDHP